MTILGDFDTTIFEEVDFGAKAISYLMFVIAMVLIQIVALNALIALLGDSYSDVDSSKQSVQRKERATLIVEHLLLTPIYGWLFRQKERGKVIEREVSIKAG